MAVIVGKGTVIKQDIATVLTAVAQIRSYSHAGAGPITFNDTTLDSVGNGMSYAPTGYSEPGTVDFEYFIDPALAGHQAITDNITTPGKVAHSITFTDAGPATWTFTSAGFTFGLNGSMSDGVIATKSMQLAGLMGYNS